MKRLYIGAAILKMMEGLPSLLSCRDDSWFVHSPLLNHESIMISEYNRNQCQTKPTATMRMFGAFPPSCRWRGSVARSEARFYEKCPRPLGKRTINTWISREQCKILFDLSRRITNHVVGRIRRPLSAMI